MSITAVEIMNLGGQNLPFSRDLREALGIYARRRWPLNTRTHAAKAWGVSKSTAANVLKGHASDATVAQIIRAGGWELALPVIGAVIGEPVHAFFRHQMQQAAKAAEHARTHEELAQASYRRLARDTAGAGEDWGPGRGTGEVGAEAPRRVASGGH